MAATHRVLYDFDATGSGMLAVRRGEQCTLLNKMDESGWCNVRTSKGSGLVPSKYLQQLTPQSPDKMKGELYVVQYDFRALDTYQLDIKKDDRLTLVDKHSKDWLTMKNTSGNIGLVPAAYVKLASRKERSQAHLQPQPQSQSKEALSEVLLSIDNAIEKIHNESALSGGLNKQQRERLMALTAHRRSVLDENRQDSPTQPEDTPTTTTPTTTTTSSSPQPLPDLSLVTNSPKRSRRRAPPPPADTSTADPAPAREETTETIEESVTLERLDLAGVELRSRSCGSREGNQSRPKSEYVLRGPAPAPPRRLQSLQKDKAKEETKQANTGISQPIIEEEKVTDEEKVESTTTVENVTNVENVPEGTKTVEKEQLIEEKETNVVSDVGENVIVQQQDAELQPDTREEEVVVEEKEPERSDEVGAGNQSEESAVKSNEEAVSSKPVSPATVRHEVAPDVEQKEVQEALPTEFPVELGTEMVELVRTSTDLSHSKSYTAAMGLLTMIQERVPSVAVVMTGLLSALHQSQREGENGVTAESSRDLERLREIFFEMKEAKDDSQQRGWAIRDDSDIICEYLEELLRIMYDADPNVSKVAIEEDKYENVLTLITFFQMESRLPLRVLLLKIFVGLCSLDQAVTTVMLSSVLPNELGRDIKQDISETHKTWLSSTVCGMMFSTAEAIPLSVYDQWDLEYVQFLLDSIEDPPDSDIEDQLPDAFLNILLSFNQHFEDPSSNLVMQALKEKDNPRAFSEKLMLLVNRGEDPIAIVEPCCPDSLTKMLLDIFSDSVTANIFYTTDLFVLIGIIVRQMSDLCPGEMLRSHYLELLYRLLGSTNYSDHTHRQDDIAACLQRISEEDEDIGGNAADKEKVKKIWTDFPGYFTQSSTV